MRVDGVELVGAESLLHGKLTDGTDLIFRVSGRTRIGIGDEVKVGASADALHMFGTDGTRQDFAGVA